ncbi:ComEC/Rec2 family competence protein [Simkania sp.]|uniref:ComEC/Rec2 family competence protein n=1 Tax=Simkania sp. TaxID=34094 RepID=UPI003B529C5A
MEKKIFTFLVIAGGYLYALLLTPLPHLSEPTAGNALFHIEQVKRHPTPFKPLLVYEGTLRYFHGENETFYRLPCRLYMPIKKNRPRASHDYFLQNVSLMEISPHRYVLKTSKKTSWQPILRTRSQAEWRFQTKEKVRKWVRKNFSEKPVQHLISGLLTGQKESRLQTFQFGQIGLQHLLAISGFHFAILTFFLAFLLRRFLPRKGMALLLICLLSAYFYYMGEAPSISRAWIGVIVFLGGMLFQRKSAPLNALGIGLLAALISKPLIILDVGFQLSFAATFGILVFYAPTERKLQQIFPKRTFQEIKLFSSLNQWGALVSVYLRKIFALNGAVLIFTLPIVLFHFHHFSFLSLVYNLFFPLLFTLLIGLLLISLILPFLLPLLAAYASFLLKLVAFAPKRLMFWLRFPEFPLELGVFIFLVLFLWGTYLHWSTSVIKEWNYS